MKEIDGLLLFLEVARRGSFSEAARWMNQPTTTISRKIQQLESELNTKLFHRTTRSLSLTEMGERLLPKAKLIIETTQEMRREVETHAGTPTGRLHITSSTTVLEKVAPFLVDFVKQYPNISFNLESASRNVDLAKHGIDFAFRLGPLIDSSLISIPIAPLRYALVAEKHFAQSRPTLTHPSDLVNWPCIRSHIDGLLYPWHFAREKETFSFDIDNFILSNDLRVSAQFVLKGLGVAYLPFKLIKKQLDEGKLVSLLDDWIPADRELNLVYINRKYLPSKSKAFIEFIRERRRLIEVAVNSSC
ncbi:MAG: LysR family transcriptional regulator [Acidobacteriota bacterium]|nr:LysR family transcriptional regulator [Acidobacteriota bacterium]